MGIVMKVKEWWINLRDEVAFEINEANWEVHASTEKDDPAYASWFSKTGQVLLYLNTLGRMLVWEAVTLFWSVVGCRLFGHAMEVTDWGADSGMEQLRCTRCGVGGTVYHS